MRRAGPLRPRNIPSPVDLEALGRDPLYGQNTRYKLTRLVTECGFKRLTKFSADAFTAWRSSQKDMAGKTLNEYLNGANAFLNWLKRQGKIVANPLENVSKVDIRGRQKRRRAIKQEELPPLLAVADDRRLLYLTAIYTKLRLRELRELLWADMHLDAERPFILTRGATTKNRKDAVIPVHPLLAPELRELTRNKPAADQPVFDLDRNVSKAFKKDLISAGVARVDGLGRKLDFHGLRYTFATRLALSKVSQRTAQELMRHSDANLTANIYTDASRLAAFRTVASMKGEGAPTGSCTHIGTQSSDFSGPGLPIAAESGDECSGDDLLARSGNERIVSHQKCEIIRLDVVIRVDLHHSWKDGRLHADVPVDPAGHFEHFRPSGTRSDDILLFILLAVMER